MIDIKKLKLFPFFTSSLAITQEDDHSYYNIIFYSENSNFSLSYPKLRIPKRFVRYGTILPSLVPRVVVFPKLLTQFVANRMIPIRSFKSYLSNLFIDTTPFLEKLDEKFQKGSYRRPIVLGKIISYLLSAKSLYPNRKNILMYHVDLTNSIPENIWDKKAFPLFLMFRSKDPIPFDYVLLALTDSGTVKYALLASPEKRLSVGRIFSILRSLKTIPPNNVQKDQEQKTQDYSHHVVSTIQTNHELENTDKNLTQVSGDNALVNDKVQRVVKSYVEKMTPHLQKEIMNQSSISPENAQKLTIRSLVYNMTRDKDKTEKILSSIDPKNYSRVLMSLKTEYAPDILEEDSYKNESRDSVFGKIGINSINQNKNPSRILNKRKIDFQQSFESDLKKSFKILEEKKKFPLKLTKFSKQAIPINSGDLEPTKTVRYTIVLKDDRNKLHTVNIDMPEVQPDGTFLINGSRRFLIYQIIIDPIFFMKKGEAVLQTMFASVATHHKKTKYKSYFTSLIAGYWIPTFLLLAYNIGFDATCKLFNIKYSIVNEKPLDRNVKVLELADGKFLVFQFSNTESEILINSLFEVKGDIISKDLNNHEMYQNLIIHQVDNRNSIYQIDTVLENIMEPISVQVLKTKMLPYNFHGCIRYICQGLIIGRIDNRNDINKQRIRSSEIFNFQIQKLILGSYNDYRGKREHGDKDASYYCDTKNIVSTIVNTSRMIRQLENINPYEELSALTQTTPIGPSGVSDVHGITKPAKNINPSYYGNIDPMDTPENHNVGVINHLTIDSAIGNTRGSFGKFDPKEDIKSSLLGTTTSVIPYISNDDGGRVLMGSSQARQAIPIVGSEKPLIQTGFETIMTSMLTDSYIRKAPVNGIILRQSPNVIYIKDGRTGKVYTIPLDNKVLRSAQGKSSLNYFHSVVKDGQKVVAGQIIAEGKHIQDGTIAVGTNLLVAIMGWKGYSFEDGYIISEKIAKEKFISAAYEEIVVQVKSTSAIKFITQEGVMTKKGDVLLIRASKEVEELLNVEEEELIEGQYVKRSPGGKIIAIEIYPNISIKKFPLLEKQYLSFKKRWEEMKGPFPEKFLVNEGGNKVPFSGVRIVFKIERLDECVIGDKMANSHGGKGVITLIEKTENMPITPWGEPIDVILNPIAILNRMNPGTLYELYTGLCAKFLAKQLVALGPKRTSKGMKLIQDVYFALDNSKDKTLTKNIVRSFMSLSDKQYAEYMQQLIKSNYILPIIVPPFQEPKKEMILKAMDVVGAKNGYRLKLPEYGGTTKNDVAVGYLYYKKLEQQAEYKASSRSVGKYETKTAQPVAGAIRGGGQRFGEFDTWTLAAHGAETVLKEILGPLSDDKRTKDEMLSEIIQTGKTSYKEPRIGTTKSVLEAYIMAMMLDIKL